MVKWTEEEDNFLIEFFSKMTSREMSDQLPQRTATAVRHRVKRLRDKGKITLKKSHRREKKIDDKKFIQMWNDGVPAKSIQKEFNLKRTCTVYWKGKKLNLPSRPRLGFNLAMKERDDALLEFLTKKGGFCEYHKTVANCSEAAIKRLIYQRRTIKVWFCLKRGPGHYSRHRSWEIFRKGFNNQIFLCKNRTALMRLLFKACKKPRNPNMWKTLTSFVRTILTHGEMLALYWHLGREVWSATNIKSSIQVDGIIMPKGASVCFKCGKRVTTRTHKCSKSVTLKEVLEKLDNIEVSIVTQRRVQK